MPLNLLAYIADLVAVVALVLSAAPFCPFPYECSISDLRWETHRKGAATNEDTDLFHRQLATQQALRVRNLVLHRM